MLSCACVVKSRYLVRMDETLLSVLANDTQICHSTDRQLINLAVGLVG
jgi:hypothetical protein